MAKTTTTMPPSSDISRNSNPRRSTRRPLLLLTVGILVILFFLVTLPSPIGRTINSTIRKNAASASSSTLVFSASPSAFLNLFADCLADPTCHLLYHHVQKTGGSNLASRLYPLLNNETYQSKDWCCNQKLVDRFHNATDDFCLTKKMSIYEVSALQFQHVLSTCTASNKKHRYIALISLREPIQRTLSMIHHQCNKNFEFKNAAEQAICKSCQYNKDSDAWFWDQFTNQTNEIYVDLLQVLQDHQPPPNNDALSFLLLDNAMIDAFFELMGEHELLVASAGDDADRTISASASTSQEHQQAPAPRSNSEKTHICNFGMTSSMMKDLRISQLIYRGLTAGYLL
jgi:hypothetical protein